MQLHKIKQYNLLELLRILIFKIVYKFKLLIRKSYISFRHSTYQPIIARNAENKYNRICSSLYSYYGFVNKDETVLKQANSIMAGTITIFSHNYSFNPEEDWLKDLETGKFWPREVYWDKAKFIESGLADVKLVLEVNKLNMVVVLAQAYYLTKEDKYIQEIERYVSGWLKCVPMEKSVVNKIVMDFGFRVINFIHISLLCCESKYFIENVHPIILGIVKHHVQHLWHYLSSRWFKAGNDNNHNIGEIVGAYIGQLWLSKFGIWGGLFLDRRTNKELVYLKIVTEKMIAPSGCYMEQSASYTRLVHDFFLMFEIFRHALDFNRNFGWFETSGYFDRLSHYLFDISYRGQLPNFGDNDYARVVIPFENRNDVVAHVSKHISNTTLPADYSEDGQWLYHSKDNNDVFIFVRSGVFAKFVEGAFVHSHNDLLAIELFAKGRAVFIDKGTLFYNSGIDIRKAFTATRAHNTVQIGKREMADFLPVGYSHYPKSKIETSERETNRCKFLGKVNYKDISHFREVSYNGHTISIVDNITKKQSGKEKGVVRFLLDEDISVKMDSNNLLSLMDKDDTKLFSMRFDGIDVIEISKTDYAPHYGLRRQTHVIEASFDIETSKVIKTVINIK